MLEVNKILCGDCIEVMRTFEDNSIDSIVTDPPYELGFMGKSWDNTGIANSVEMWGEALRVLKPGGHLMAFSGTRTYHRMVVAIEDAGFEIRDMIEWMYGSGFPKSLNIGKAVDKLQGNERISTGEIKHHAQKGVAIAEERGAVGGGAFGQAKDEEVTKGTSEYEGWGTALKPAHEPICLARKPLSEKTVAENCLKWGTGGINIDGCRVETEDNLNGGAYSKGEYDTDGKVLELGLKRQEGNYSQPAGRFPANLIHDNSEEIRECFPDTGKGNGKGAYNYSGREYDNKDTSMFNGDKPQAPSNFNDSGNASRFFKSILYYPKASKSERNRGCEGLETSEKFTAGNYSQSPVCKDCNLTLNGTNDHCKCSGEVYYKEMETKNTKNNHPTVKPVALMEYLIKMVTPKNGIVLDMFGGSGTTAVACINTGFNYVLIEQAKDYVKIAQARVGWAEKRICE